MGLGTFIAEFFQIGNGISKLIGIKRAFFHQGLLLVSVCRQLPDPFPDPTGKSQQELRDVLKLVMDALTQGAEANAKKDEVKTAFEDAKNKLCRYIDNKRISLLPIRGSTDQMNYNGKHLSEEMNKARQKDENASQILDHINDELKTRVDQIRKMPQIHISFKYFPDLEIPQLVPDPKRKDSLFKVPHDYHAPIYFAKNIFKVEKGTSIEMLVHRLLQCTKHDQSLEKLSLLRRPELYERTSDRHLHRTVPSLFPLHTVDKYGEEYLILTIEIESKSNMMITIPNVGSKPLPPGWTNIWIIQETGGQYIMVRKNDNDFTLRTYTTKDFFQRFCSDSSIPQNELPGSTILESPNMRMPQPLPAVLPYNTSGSQPEMYPVQGGPPAQCSYSARGTQEFQPSPSPDPTSIAQGTNPRMPAPVPLQNAPRAGGVANPSLPPPPATPPVQPTPSSRSLRPSYTATSSTFTVDSTTSSQNAKMQIPDSAAASHHTTGDMKTVGREKKPNKSSGGFMSKIRSLWG